MKKSLFLTYICLIFSILTTAQNKRVKGKIIKDFGETFVVNNPDIKTDTTVDLKVILDVSKSSEDKSVINKYIVTAARFLNMHANEGMKPEQLKAAITIHGSAWQDVLKNDIYKAKFGVDNPNLKLIKQLNAAGVDVIICGQTAAVRKMGRDDVTSEVKFALSAMTALLQYQNIGFKILRL
jgi:intracellular sulfur oxidation DsrE/DsrF family protein